MVDFNDLPAELAAQVIGYCVKNVGINAAWKRRRVCKAFSTYITHEIVSHQTLKVYRLERNRRLVNHLLPLILECRALVNNAVPDAVPSVIRKIVNSLMRVTGQTTATERTACTKRVCADFVRYSSRALYYTFRPSAKSNARFASLTGNAEALCIAIGRGDRALVDQIIQSGVSVYGKTFLFEDVLSFAVANCQKGELTALLATSGPAPDNRTRGLQKRLVDVRICTQVEEVKFGLGRVEMAIELLTWYDLNPQASLVQSSKVWLEETCSYNRLSHTHRKQDKLNFIAAVFAHNPAIKIRKAYRDNFLKGYHGYDAELVTAAIPVLIQEKVFEANDVDSTSTGLTAEKPHTLLDVAVNIRDVGTVAAVLALGANPDGIFLGAPSAYRTYSPLDFAVKRRSIPVVRLLLQHGAEPLAGYGTNPQMLEPLYVPHGPDITTS